MKKLKWGIVSSGRICALFCDDLIQLDEAEIYGVAARNIESAKKFAEKYKIKNTYEGYQAMFDDPNIDVVYIGTPHTLHFENARNAILSGKHVLCEKPMVVTPEQAKELSDLAKKQGVFLMEAMWTYFLPAIQKAKQWVDEGRIGKLKHIKVDFGYPMEFSPESRVYNVELAGGCLFDVGIYPLAVAWYFSGADLDNLHVINQNAPNGVEDDVMITADCGDAKATLGASFQCHMRNGAYIIGDEGYIVIPDSYKAYECSLYKMEDCLDKFVDDRKTHGYIYEAKEVTKQINNGALESNIMPHSTSLKLQQQIAKIKSLCK